MRRSEFEMAGIPLSPRSIGMIALGCEIPQDLWGTITCGQNLDGKELSADVGHVVPKRDEACFHSIVPASTMIADLRCRGKVGCHKGLWKKSGRHLCEALTKLVPSALAAEIGERPLPRFSSVLF